MCIYSLIEQQALKTPEAIAIQAPGRAPLSFQRLRDRLDGLLAALNAVGIERGDRVALVLPNGSEMAVAFLAVAAGATAAPLNPAYRETEFEFYLSDLEAKLLILPVGTDSPARVVAQRQGIEILELQFDERAEAGFFEPIVTRSAAAAEPLAPARPDDVALVLHTSGTTARPKIVPLTHRNICTAVEYVCQNLGLSEGDRCLNMMPQFHIGGLVDLLLCPLSAGGSVICTSGFSASQFFQELDKFCPTWYQAVPTMLHEILVRADSYPQNLASSSLRFIRAVAAPLPPRVMAQLEECFQVPVIETFGMTEAAPLITSNPLPPARRKPGSVGISVGPKVAILDEGGIFLPVGEIGEVAVRGDNIISGYENNPEANAAAFVKGWFRTGDRGYLDEEGYLFLKGRFKELINRGGEKIAPREVEEVLLDHPAVEQAVAFAVPHKFLGEDVGVAVVLKAGATLTQAELTEFAAARLSEFKVPRVVLLLEEIPKGPTGKVQRLDLAEQLGLTAATARPPLVLPETPTQKQLAEIWSEILQVKPIGLDDNFFALGGHSLLATRVISRLRQAFGIDLLLQTLFEAPTLAELSDRTETICWASQQSHSSISGTTDDNANIATHSHLPPILPAPREQDLPLSFAQQRLWFLDRLEPGSIYNLPVAYRLIGQLNINALERSLNEIIQRHEVLRTTFPSIDGEPSQAIAPKVTFTLPITDLRDRLETESEAQQPFNLATGPLFRAKLLRLAKAEYVLLLNMHHIISDGWSFDIFFRELTALYTAFSTDRPSPLPELPIQYADFTLWQHNWLQGEVLESQLSYWKQQLSGSLPTLQLPTDYPRPPVQTYQGAERSLELPLHLTEALKALCQREEVTLFMTLLAAFQTLLSRYSGQEEIVVGTPIAGRNHVETEDLIGFFVNTLALRTPLSGNPSFQELLSRVREVALGAYSHQELPFEKLVKELQPERDRSHTPLFQVMFALQNTSGSELRLPGLTVNSLNIESSTAKFDLTLFVKETAQGLVASLEYNTDLFKAATVNRMLGHFQTLLEGIVANPEQHLSDLPLLTSTEQHQLLAEWNNTQTDYPRNICIHELFKEQVERTPNAIAVIFDNQQLTYRELNHHANQLARYLQKLGVKPEVTVGICMERSLETIVALLAILKAGGAYVPLDPTYPQERLAFMLDDTRVPVLLTQQKRVEKLPPHQARVVCLDADWERINRESQENFTSCATADNLAYVMYTSGSTGIPKGVSVIHRGVVRLVQETNYVHLTAEEVFLQLAPISFDASTFEIWGCLLNGGKLIVMPPHTPSLEELGQAIKRYQITTLWLTAGLFHVMVDERIEDFKSVRQLLAGGDILSVSHVKKFLQTVKDCKLINGYGPTENTTFTCCYTIAEADRIGNSIPIGYPIANTQVYVLDSHLKPVPIGVQGELYIGGDGLARGYLNRPDLTEEKFIPNPFQRSRGAEERGSREAKEDPSSNPERLYKTGDLVRYLPDSTIEFIGRIDNQVKIRGFRIELGEIEAAIAQHPSVQKTVVTAREDRPGNKRLVAYIVLNPEQALTADELRDFLKQKLPDYMMPSAFVFLDTLPLTSNGKIDRRALPAPERIQQQPTHTFVAPHDDLEFQIVKIWEKVLGKQSIGVKDNFFDLGGHSLLAVRLLAQIEKTFAKKLPLTALFQAPTVEEFAKIFRQPRWSAAWPSLVPIQPQGFRPILFGIHVLGKSLEFYKLLAHYLGQEQPLYGISTHLIDPKHAPPYQVKELASFYVKEIQLFQPSGPYFLAGVSFGGTVVFEMAHQLIKQGEQVALLVLFDTHTPNAIKRLPLNEVLSVYSESFFQKGFSFARSEQKKVFKLFKKKLKRKLDLIVIKFYQSIGHSLPESLQNIVFFQKNEEAANNYIPQVYPDQVTLFRAEKSKKLPLGFYRDPNLGWGELVAGKLDIHDVPGSHSSMVREPRVQVLAQKLKACIDEAIAEASKDSD